MYWYYKVPLIIILVLIVGFASRLVWKVIPREIKEKPVEMFADEERQAKKPVQTPSDPVPNTPNTQQPAAANLPSNVSAGIDRKLEIAASHLRKRQLKDAIDLSRSVVEELDRKGLRFTKIWYQAGKILSDANIEMINCDAPYSKKEVYEIISGDTLSGIANRFDTTITAVQKGNDLDPVSPMIYPGHTLRIYRGQWWIDISKQNYTLILMDGDQLFKIYRIAIGREDRTPIGTFEIENKLKEPTWTPAGKVIPYGDPENVLGTRWMGLLPIATPDSNLSGYGIHGTWDPNSIGTAASKGCIRMRNEDVNELFDIVTIGTRVEIKEQ